jgi:MFS family permease
MTRLISAGRVTFAALSVPNYRRYISGQAVSLVGTWMQMTAQSWLVLTLTNSSTDLGLIVALQTLPVLLLGPYGGVIADRVDKRRLMVVLQSVMGIQALALGLLTVTGAVRLWEIGLLAALLGLNNAFENPARQSFMLEMVGEEHLRNAVSLNSVLVNVARAIGPAVAGILIATAGDGVCFLVNAVSFVAVVTSLIRLDHSSLHPSPPTGREPGQLREGLRYIRRTPELRIPLLMMAIVGCLGYEFQVSLPVMARQGLHTGAAGFGFMTAAMANRRQNVGDCLGGVWSDLCACRRCAQPADRARRADAGRMGEHLVHVHGQLHTSARRRANHERAGHVAVVRGFPRLDPDRRSAHRLADGLGGRPRGPRYGRHRLPVRRAARSTRDASDDRPTPRKVARGNTERRRTPPTERQRRDRPWFQHGKLSKSLAAQADPQARRTSPHRPA